MVLATPVKALVRTALVIPAAILAASCVNSLPTAPSDVTTGLVIYLDANFLGPSAHITKDIADLKDYKGPCILRDSGGPDGGTSQQHRWNDCVSSIRIASGWRATAYRDDHFKGESLEITADVPNLQLVRGSCPHDGMNDCITSIRVFAP